MERIPYKPAQMRSQKAQTSVVDSFLSSTMAKILLLGISFFLFYNIFHSVKITIQKLEILEQAEQEVNDLRIKNLELSLELEQMKEISYLEVEARDRLNFAGEDEILFVIPESLLERSQESLETILKEESGVSEISTVEAWKNWLI